VIGAEALPKKKQNKNKGNGMIPPKLTAVSQAPGLEDGRAAAGSAEPEAEIDASEMLAHEGWRGLPPNVAQLPSADRREQLRILEALLFAASEPMAETFLSQHLRSSDDVAALLDELKGFYASRGVNLVKVADKWMFRQVMVFASAEDASRAMDVIAGQVFPQCMFDLIDRIIPLGRRMNATTKSETWQAPPIASHGDRQVAFGQLVRYTVSTGNVDIYLINVYVQVGRAIAWVDPQYFPESTTPLYRVDRAVDASVAALAHVFGD